MADGAPFEIVIRMGKDLTLEVTIHSRSSTAQTYCHDMFWQPCLLTLKDPSGNVVHNNDQRVIMRPLTPIAQHAFRKLSPGGTGSLYSNEFEKVAEGGYRMYWGHQQFHQIPPGKYKALVTFECQRESWADEDRKWHKEEGVWTGIVVSNEIDIELP